MAIREIRHYPNPVLAQKGETVTVFDAKFQRLIDDMIETMYAAPGIGLAAHQIGLPLQLFIIDGAVQDPDHPIIVMANPSILSQEGEVIDEEGCLSLPQYVDHVKRAASITMAGLDRNGKPSTLEGNGLLARAMQHEYDHVQGVLMLDRLSPLKRSLYIKRIKKLEKNRAHEHAAVG
ncbi:MAG: peptide deformylase [Nitrospiraceae bacterium]|nr:peptide deformylase [Nitrospiraceae bacterium]